MDFTAEEIDEIGAKLEHGGFSDEDIDTWFEHSGVKGMKWGTRREKTRQRIVRVGQGKGTLRDKIAVGAGSSTHDLVRGKGFKGAAQIRGQRQTDRKARILNGEATAKDALRQAGSFRMTDIGTSKKGTKTTKSGANKSIVIMGVVGGAAFATLHLAARKM